MMKKVILLCGMLLAVTAAIASAAQGVNLRWQACFGDGGTFNRAFACDTNVGSHILVGGFELAADAPQASGNEMVVDFAADAPTMPAWWELKSTAGSGCRNFSLTFNTTIPAAAVNCVDWSNGNSAGGIAAYSFGYLSVPGLNTARLLAATAVPTNMLQNLFGGVEYFSFNLVINNTKTTGTGSCAGCSTPVCIVFNSMWLNTPFAANNRKLTGPTNGTDSNICTWQGGGNPTTSRGTGCPASTPTRNSTWGAVKSLYR